MAQCEVLPAGTLVTHEIVVTAVGTKSVEAKWLAHAEEVAAEEDVVLPPTPQARWLARAEAIADGPAAAEADAVLGTLSPQARWVLEAESVVADDYEARNAAAVSSGDEYDIVAQPCIIPPRW